MGWPNSVSRSDLRIDFYRGSGKGGQKRNKTSNCCRITHAPTGLQATAEDTRSAFKNRSLAFRRLTEKLLPLMLEAIKEKPPEIEMVTIRTYHDKRGIKDHRTGQTFPFDDPIDETIIDKIRQEIVLGENNDKSTSN